MGKGIWNVHSALQENSKCVKHPCRQPDTRIRAWDMNPTFSVGHAPRKKTKYSSYSIVLYKMLIVCMKRSMAYCKHNLPWKTKEIVKSATILSVTSTMNLPPRHNPIADILPNSRRHKYLESTTGELQELKYSTVDH